MQDCGHECRFVKAKCWLVIVSANLQKRKTVLFSSMQICGTPMLDCSRNCKVEKPRCRVAIVRTNLQKRNARLRSRLQIWESEKQIWNLGRLAKKSVFMRAQPSFSLFPPQFPGEEFLQTSDWRTSRHSRTTTMALAIDYIT